MSIGHDEAVAEVMESDLGRQAVTDALAHGCLACGNRHLSQLEFAVALPKEQFDADEKLLPEMDDSVIFFVTCNCRGHRQEVFDLCRDKRREATEQVRTILRSARN